MLKYFCILVYSFFIFTNANAFLDNDGDGAKSTGREDLSFLNVKNSNFKKGKDALQQAIKYKKKNKVKKKNKQLEKAIKYFVLAYKENTDDVDILYYLGLTYGMVGDFNMSEIYFQQGLYIDPKNNFINQKLGELYVNTKRINLAEERLEILINCNCEEYYILKKMIYDKK